MALDAEQIGKVRLLLMSSGWNDVLKPVIANRAHGAIKALVLHPSERKGEYEGVDDTALRAKVQECEWMLSVWSNEIAVHEHNRRIEELDRQDNGGEPQRANVPA